MSNKTGNPTIQDTLIVIFIVLFGIMTLINVQVHNHKRDYIGDQNTSTFEKWISPENID